MAHGNEINNKRYYWLKLDRHFFRDARIKKLRRIAGGDTYTIIYLKLMLLSIERGGLLIYEGIEETFEAEMANKLDEDEENVRVTIHYLRNQGLLIEKNGGDGFLPQAAGSIGSETYNNVYKRKQKQNAQLGAGDGLENLQPNSNPIPIEADIDTDKNIDYIPPAPARIGDEIVGMKEFCERFNITVDGYDGTVSDIDFTLLAQFYEDSKTFLQDRPFAKNLGWICKNYKKILTGYYNDFKENPSTKKGKGAARERGTDILKNLFNQAAAEEDADDDGTENNDGKP